MRYWQRLTQQTTTLCGLTTGQKSKGKNESTHFLIIIIEFAFIIDATYSSSGAFAPLTRRAIGDSSAKPLGNGQLF
jgi:hypothetical protein